MNASFPPHSELFERQAEVEGVAGVVPALIKKIIFVNSAPAPHPALNGQLAGQVQRGRIRDFDVAGGPVETEGGADLAVGEGDAAVGVPLSWQRES